MRPPIRSVILAGVLATPCVAGPASAAISIAAPAAAPWEDQFLTAAPREIAAAAKNIEEADAPLVVLFEERVQTFQADGSSQARYRRVYKVLTQEGVDNNDIEASWAPWHEDQPMVRARVVTREGRAFALDPRTIEASGMKGAEADMYTDRRQLRAPLPGLARGAVVEEEYVIVERPVAAGLGSSNEYFFGTTVPVRHTRLVLDAPRGLPLHLVQRPASSLPVKRSEAGQRVRLVFEAGPLPATARADEGWPDDVPVVPSIQYATGPSWREIAARYAELVDRQLVGADLASWVAEARSAMKGRGRDQLVASLLARLHREVRYTGVEFEDASIVPRRPADVLARGYGDCKDQAALLVALLRAAGIPAAVALLRVGGSDVDARLPSLEAFDHAIVYIPPAPRGPGGALWVDATAPFAPVGELPIHDVNRHALVAGLRGDELLVTPLAAAGHSRIKEVRRIVLEDSGRPHVLERTEAQGAAARSYRRSWSTTDKKKMGEALLSYVKEQYGAGGLVRFDVGDAADVSKPPTLELEARDIEIGSVWDEGASVVARSGVTLGQLPEGLRGDKDLPAGTKPRTVDFVIREPYVYELAYQIVPPHGFSADPLPAPETRALGTASLRSSYAVDPRGVVTATFVFDTGKARLTPAEVDAFRAGVKAFMQADVPVIGFHAVGAVALASGKVRDALSLFRRLDAEHPHQALHARQIAGALLVAGLGQAARDEARRAVVADPKSAEGERVLGWTLEHDLLGRRFGVSADLEAAEAAYRRALARDPKNGVARASLAILLEHDRMGQHTFPAPHLAEMERLYDELEKAGEKAFVINHLLALLYQERFREVIKRVHDTTGASAEAMIFLAAVAATQGPASALREAGSRISDNARRAEALRGAGAELLRLRRYSEAATLYDQAARDHTNGAALRGFAERLRRARRRETIALDLTKPADVAKSLLVETMVAAGEGRPLAVKVANRLAAPELALPLTQPQTVASLHASLKNLSRVSGDIPMIAMADILSGVVPEVEGRPELGYRVRFPAADANVRPSQIMVAVLPQGLRVVSLQSDSREMAREALRLVHAGRLEGARAWLDWILEGESLGRVGEPLSGSLLARVWSHDDGARGAADAELAAAVMLSLGAKASDGPVDALPILRRARDDAGPEGRRLGVRLAMLMALMTTDKLAEADGIAAGLQRQYPHSRQALEMRLDLLTRRGLGEDAVRLAAAEVKAHPDQLELQGYLAGAQLSAGRLAEAEASYARLAASSKATPGHYNQVAWLRLCRGDASQEAQAAAERGVELSSRHDPHVLHTLAAVLAERDQPEKAREVLIESLNERADDEATDDDSYVLGRIAESYGFPESARSLYGQLKKPTSKPFEISSFALAQKRAARLRPLAASPGE